VNGCRQDDLLALVLGFARSSAFSPRETQVLLKYVLEMKANKEIAADLGVTYSTIRLYWTRICRKTACEGPRETLKYLLRYALLGCPRCHAGDDTKSAT
jgi:DNA-binding NarL/FixJ family response regulator